MKRESNPCLETEAGRKMKEKRRKEKFCAAQLMFGLVELECSNCFSIELAWGGLYFSSSNYI